MSTIRYVAQSSCRLGRRTNRPGHDKTSETNHWKKGAPALSTFSIEGHSGTVEDAGFAVESLVF